MRNGVPPPANISLKSLNAWFSHAQDLASALPGLALTLVAYSNLPMLKGELAVGLTILAAVFLGVLATSVGGPPFIGLPRLLGISFVTWVLVAGNMVGLALALSV